MQSFRRMRVPGDTIFALGALILAAFVFTSYSSAKPREEEIRQPIPVPVAD
jgi:hypothetical protein